MRISSHDTSPVDLQDAVVSYQILEMRHGFPIAKQFLIDLNPEDLREVERTAEGRNFRFPVAFAPNLQRISVLHTLFWEEHDGSIQKQRIHVPLPQPAPPLAPSKRKRWSYKRLWKNTKRTEQAEQTQPIPAQKPRFYKMKFSPCGQFVAHAERQNDNNELSWGYWDFTVWKRESSDTSVAQASVWQQVATLCDIYGDFLHDGNFEFNPQFQTLALMEIDRCNQTSIWKFGTPTQGKCV